MHAATAVSRAGSQGVKRKYDDSNNNIGKPGDRKILKPWVRPKKPLEFVVQHKLPKSLMNLATFRCGHLGFPGCHMTHEVTVFVEYSDKTCDTTYMSCYCNMVNSILRVCSGRAYIQRYGWHILVTKYQGVPYRVDPSMTVGQLVKIYGETLKFTALPDPTTARYQVQGFQAPSFQAKSFNAGGPLKSVY